MGSHMNFRNFVDASQLEGNSGKLQGSTPLARQSSIYSLTFDELQNTWSGLGKDFGSMNMDELLKNIWSAEETQAMTSSVVGGEGSVPGGNLQRQGSLTLPRTLSQKTVDEVWRDLFKESGGMTREESGGGGSNLPQRQRTLGEMTLEEFLVRAGVVREENQLVGRPSDVGIYGDLAQLSSHAGLVLGFQQQSHSNGLAGDRIVDNKSFNPVPPPSLAMNAATIKPPQAPTQQQPLFPKPANVGFASSMQLANTTQNLGSKVAAGIADAPMSNALMQGGALQTSRLGVAGLGTRGLGAPMGSPGSQMSPGVISNNSVDASTLSPVPYAFGRGRKAGGALEKVVERRQRRMIKNRESAARSRARKQAYTLELEAEVAKLKELNQELEKKQAEFMEVQKNQILQKVNGQWASNRQCLRRTLTGPW